MKMYRQTLLTDFYKKITKTKKYKKSLNTCIRCNCDLGDHNPRQLCGKTYCLQLILFL